MRSVLREALDPRRLRAIAGERSYHRGIDYYSSGRVIVLLDDAGIVRAKVRGTRDYDVSLWAEDGEFASACTCPLGADGVFCKHCVAAALAWLARDGAVPTPRTRQAGAPQGDGRRVAGPSTPRSLSSWTRRLADLAEAMGTEEAARARTWPVGREIAYVVDAAAAWGGRGFILELVTRRRKASGGWQVFSSLTIPGGQIEDIPDPADRRILGLLAGAGDAYGYSPYYQWSARRAMSTRYAISEALQETLIPLLCATGRFHLRMSPGQDVVVDWDDGLPWQFHLEVTREREGGRYTLTGVLRRGEERMAVSDPVLLLSTGFVFVGARCGRLEDFGAFAWISHLRRDGPIVAAEEHGEDLLHALMRLPKLPRLTLPPELRYEEATAIPVPRLAVRRAPPEWRTDRLWGELSFDYDGTVITAGDPGRGLFQARERRFLLRDRAAEEGAAVRLQQLGFRRAPSYDTGADILALPPRVLPRAVRALTHEGWRVEAEGRLYRRPGAVRVEVASRIDWFELRGAVEFGDVAAPLPAVLAAVRRGDPVVLLGDGTYGVLPEEWLARYGLLAGLGKPEHEHLRFARSQVGLLDALLASQPDTTCDETFARAREELRRFDGVAPVDPPRAFAGVLRGYQRDGLGWFRFLQRFHFGGCLADDMGLGKTVQVLALLASRRDQAAGPSLVVVPKSLVFNWKEEAARFAPELRVLDHTGTGRTAPGDHYRAYDVVLTTYGTLRRDAPGLAGVQFDYVILDEAQAVKHAGTVTAKAARLLRSSHRLVLTGTPVENHLGELWSLFEFLNPGMLGAASVFRLGGVDGRDPPAETRALLAQALRPFILRRTKEQVARELPPKNEQTLFCELSAPERAVYNDLRDHYRRALLGRIERDGLARAKIFVLEALVRLRQAACHLGLIDRSRRGEPSAKLDLLLARLGEVVDGGHKALVFSQFTSLLAIVRDRLDRDRVPYAYLDGRTRDRAARVREFERDSRCALFLVSLKAGGLGLNLTAADYVFLLDPWWNPAAEAQAIDRAHRIGQTRPVFAYRLIARDTVEEKVLALQDTKRALAQSIITAENSLIRTLSREDLEVLFS